MFPPTQETKGGHEGIGDTRREIGQTAEEERREGTQAQGEDGLGQARPGMLHVHVYTCCNITLVTVQMISWVGA